MKTIKASEMKKGTVLIADNGQHALIKSIEQSEFNDKEVVFFTFEVMETGEKKNLNFIDADKEFNLATESPDHKEILKNRMDLLENILEEQSKILNSIKLIINENYKGYSINNIYRVAQGKGFKKYSLQLELYKVGEYGVLLTFHVGTLQIENVKTIGKYSAKETREIKSTFENMYYRIIKNVLAEEVNNIQNNKKTTQETTEAPQQTNNTNHNESYTVGNRSFTTHSEALQYCLESDFDPSLMIVEGSHKQMQPLNLQYFSDSNNSLDYYGFDIITNRGCRIKRKNTTVKYEVEYTNDFEYDEINYTDIYKIQCIDLEETIQTVFNLRSRNKYNIKAYTLTEDNIGWLTEDNTDILDYLKTPEQSEQLNKAYHTINRLEEENKEMELFQEFLNKYNATDLYKKFKEEKETIQKAV